MKQWLEKENVTAIRSIIDAPEDTKTSQKIERKKQEIFVCTNGFATTDYNLCDPIKRKIIIAREVHTFQREEFKVISRKTI